MRLLSPGFSAQYSKLHITLFLADDRDNFFNDQENIPYTQGKNSGKF